MNDTRYEIFFFFNESHIKTFKATKHRVFQQPLFSGHQDFLVRAKKNETEKAVTKIKRLTNGLMKNLNVKSKQM